MIFLQPLLLTLLAAKERPLAHHANARLDEFTVHSLTKTVYHTSVRRASGKVPHSSPAATRHIAPPVSSPHSVPHQNADRENNLAARHSADEEPSEPATLEGADLHPLNITFHNDNGYMATYLPDRTATAFCKNVSLASVDASEPVFLDLEIKIRNSTTTIPVREDSALVFCKGHKKYERHSGSSVSTTLPSKASGSIEISTAEDTGGHSMTTPSKANASTKPKPKKASSTEDLVTPAELTEEPTVDEGLGITSPTMLSASTKLAITPSIVPIAKSKTTEILATHDATTPSDTPAQVTTEVVPSTPKIPAFTPSITLAPHSPDEESEDVESSPTSTSLSVHDKAPSEILGSEDSHADTSTAEFESVVPLASAKALASPEAVPVASALYASTSLYTGVHITPLPRPIVTQPDDADIVHVDVIASTVAALKTPTPAATDIQVQEVGHQHLSIETLDPKVTAYRRTAGAAVSAKAWENAATRRPDFWWWWRTRDRSGKRAHGEDMDDVAGLTYEAEDDKVTSSTKEKTPVRTRSNSSSVKIARPTRTPELSYAHAEEDDDNGEPDDYTEPSHAKTKSPWRPTISPAPSTAATPEHEDAGTTSIDEESSGNPATSSPPITRKPSKPTTSPIPSKAAATDHNDEDSPPEDDTSEAPITTTMSSTKPPKPKHTPKPTLTPADEEDASPTEDSSTSAPNTNSSKPKPTLTSQDVAPTQYGDPDSLSYSFPTPTATLAPPPLPPFPLLPSALLSWDSHCTPTLLPTALHSTPSHATSVLGCWKPIDDKHASNTNMSSEPDASSAAWGVVQDPRLRWTVVLMWSLAVLQVVLAGWEFADGAWGVGRWLPVVGRVGWWDGAVARAQGDDRKRGLGRILGGREIHGRKRWEGK
jgi:hypothetical protein